MMNTRLECPLPDVHTTIALGKTIARLLAAGDTLFLIGDLGAGKSTLARAIIHSFIGESEPVPSPTFTITQHYETPDFRIIHADLYRLAEPDELEEIGLDFEADVTLIEWPDRLEHLAPPDRLEIRLKPSEDGGRVATVSGMGRSAESLATAVCASRDDLRTRFLDTAGWGEAHCFAIPCDASGRRYYRVSNPENKAILMDAPYAAGEDVRPFIAVTRMLKQRGLSAPEIKAEDARHGFLLLEDLGDAIFAPVCTASPDLEIELYQAATDILPRLGIAKYDEAPDYDMHTMLREAALLVDWWCPAADVEPSQDMRNDYLGIFAEVLKDIAETRSTLVLRDYHAENLIWLPERDGLARVGLLDYQDALLGHPAYDLVSLLEDARRDVSPEIAEMMIKRFLSHQPGLDPASFRADYANLGAQRNAKIVGIFARLCKRDGKPRYLSMIQRVWAHLERDLEAPHLDTLRDFIQRHVPAPTEALLKRIALT